MESLIALIIIPVILGIIKSLFNDEIEYWIGVTSSLLHRPFDLDNNPSTPDWCMLYNSGAGQWEYVSITFHFGLFKGKNGVFVTRYNNEWEAVSVERIPFAKWKTLPRAKICYDTIPTSLRIKLERCVET